MRPQKALFVGPNLAAGGAERQWSVLLPGLRERDIDARVLALDAGGPFETDLQGAGVPVEILHLRHQLDVARLFRSRLLRSFVPETVVTRGVSGAYVGELLALRARAGHLYADHRQVGLALTRRRELLTRLIAPRFDAVVVVTPEQSSSWIRRGVARNRLVVIPNGIPEQAASADRDCVRRSLGIPTAAVVILFLATLRPEKRVADFLESVRVAQCRYPNIVALVAGDGPDRPVVESEARSNRRIRYLGFRRDTTALLAAADIFALTSQFEAQPMAILEAMAAGLPIVATHVGGVPSLVSPGESGIVVPPGDNYAMGSALASLAADDERRARMARASRSIYCRSFTADKMIARYAELLRAVRG